MAIEDVFYNEAKRIPDDEIRRMVLEIAKQLPRAFWFREASTKYHHEEEQGEQGNLIHSLRVSKIVDIVYPGLNRRDSIRFSLLKAGALLHDGRRHGPDGKSEYSVKNHASLMGNFILDSVPSSATDSYRAKASALAQLVMAHMGQWDPEPVKIDAEDKAILHFADLIAASPLIGIEYR